MPRRSCVPAGLLVYAGAALPPVPGEGDETANHIRGQSGGAGDVPQRGVFILGMPGARRPHAGLLAGQYPPARARSPAEPVLDHTEGAGGTALPFPELAQRSFGPPGRLGESPPVSHAQLDPARHDIVGEPPPVFLGHMTVLPPSRHRSRRGYKTILTRRR